MQRLEKHGIRPGFLVVIANHTARSIDYVYDFLRERGQGLPAAASVRDGPDERPLEEVNADRATINSALARIFQRWFEDGRPFPVRPFDEYLMVVVLKMLGLPRGFKYDRRAIGDKVFMVKTDGRIYRPCTDYSEAFALGNLRALSDKPERPCEGCWSEAFRPPVDATRPGRQNDSA